MIYETYFHEWRIVEPAYLILWNRQSRIGLLRKEIPFLTQVEESIRLDLIFLKWDNSGFEMSESDTIFVELE